jgi:hypothetical protein
MGALGDLAVGGELLDVNDIFASAYGAIAARAAAVNHLAHGRTTGSVGYRSTRPAIVAGRVGESVRS